MILRTLVLLAVVATGIPARAEDTNPLVGTWRVVSFERQMSKRKPFHRGLAGTRWAS
jgi:hypothetical protein